MTTAEVLSTLVSKGYKDREAQRKMALNIEWGIENKEHMIFEAPTGTGKSLAYLIPIILSGSKTIITTNNKNLQNQIYTKDLPAAIDLCKIERTFTLMKGRNNYLCSEALAKSMSFILPDQQEKLLEWAEKHNGDLAYLPKEIDPRFIEHICCSEYIDHTPDSVCYFQQAKQRAWESDIVIANHTLVALDGYLKQETAGHVELLPQAEILVIDEAHEFAESVKKALEDKLTLQGMKKFFTQIKAPQLYPLLHAFEQIVKTTPDLFETIDFGPIIEQLKDVKTEGDEMYKRKKNMLKRLRNFQQYNEKEGRWIDRSDTKVAVNRRLLTVGDILPSMCFQGKTVFLTSATLATNKNFSYIKKELGITQARTGIYDSPFNYAKNCRLFIPDVNDKDNEQKIPILEQLLDASQGRAFVLFTSKKDMEYVYERTSSKYNIILQGGNGKSTYQILKEFHETPNSVLFGLKSFWQGVDIQGDALSMVVIWRLPFEYWMDPIVQILSQKMPNFFNEKYLPDCVINLKQGIGRLIRTETDRGVIVVMDPRIKKSYSGRIMLNLPPCLEVQRVEDVKDFFANKSSKTLSQEEFFKLCEEKGMPKTIASYNSYLNNTWDDIMVEFGSPSI